MSERGMKKWAPFSSLSEQENFLQKMIQYHKREQEPILSEDQIADIEYILNNYADSKLRIYYFDGRIRYVEGYINKIDSYNNIIYLNDSQIRINKIKEIQLR